MDFEFSEEEKLFRTIVREFCQKHVAPEWLEIDEKKEIPPELIRRIADQGLFGIPVKEEYGGQGGTLTMSAIAVEEIAYADPAMAIPVYTLLSNGWPFMLQLYGTEEAKGEILPLVTKGEAFYGIATTEPQGGSDVAGMRMTATKTGGEWRISGEKAYISGVREVLELPWGGGWFLVARTGPVERGHRALTAFSLLGRKDGKVADGFEPEVYEEIGRHGISTGGFRLSEVAVEDKYRMGDEDRGFYYVMEGFNIARIVVAAACLGSARWALDHALEWFRERKLFGRYISSFQGVSFRFAELYTELEAARFHVYKSAWLADKVYMEKDSTCRPIDLNVPIAMAKMRAPEVAVEIFEETLKWYGAYGYTKECPAYRGWLGTFSYVIGAEGAQNIMRYIIARDVIGSEYVRA
ncbi:MAG: acyl-CoA dehydrogenase family protein [Candidatus Bathyarchaeia archaeon]